MNLIPRAVEPSLLERYGGPAPRYTSYPTAPDWSGDVAADDYGALLERAAERAEPLAVYVHVPFCEKRCLFCGCNVQVARDRRQGDAFLESLEREVATARRAGLGARAVEQLHLGGGTPTWLSVEQLERLKAILDAAFSFAPEAELGVEADPRNTSREQIRTLGRLGFNRISFGVQDLDDAVQQTVRREQSAELTRDLMEAARSSGFRSVNLDLIYGLPNQTRTGFAETLEKVLALEPERVALFSWAYVPQVAKHHRALDVEHTPSAEEKIEILADAVEAFTAHGYAFLGLDHFARANDELAQAAERGELHRNFMGYTSRARTDVVGFGPSAIGELGGAYVQNERSVAAWHEAVARRGHAVVRGTVCPPKTGCDAMPSCRSCAV